MKSLTKSLSLALLQAPLAVFADIPPRQREIPYPESVRRLSDTDVQWPRADDPYERITFSCLDSQRVFLTPDNKLAACCEIPQVLKGPKDGDVLCCVEDHIMSGSKDVGFECCPKDYTFDGTLCREPPTCKNGMVLKDGKCVCPEGLEEAADGTCQPPAPPTECDSGLQTGKCYMFKGESGHRLAHSGNQYSEKAPNKVVVPGKFQLCREESCEPGKPVNPSHEVYIRDLQQSYAPGNDGGQWLNSATGGLHIGKTPNFSAAGHFQITKWPCGKYCLGGFTMGLGMACLSTDPSISFYTNRPDACIEYELIEVPCNNKDDANNCAWKGSSNPCCGRLDCTGGPANTPYV
ncbi:hypothetical protein S7711_11233 [Stachybotrys chartarum IBT 7711]|uniref:Cysteine-rich secreted protein n=1 Tax=Stachybotrys chartarum (strain CBS 109288 / IBT 7711) TaxID=1280523 RepID=A0A084AQM4_STACB|nr:hypothetical protein S7711_11233 [Stachybotrys chartarum IBT 7711]